MTQNTSQPYAFRTIVDYDKRTMEPYFVIGPRSVNSFWIQSSRLPQLLTMLDGSVAVMDSVKDQEVQKTKEVYRDGNSFVFFTNEEISGSITLEKLQEIMSMFEEAPRAATLAETDRAAEVRNRVAALRSTKPSGSTPPTASLRG